MHDKRTTNFRPASDGEIFSIILRNNTAADEAKRKKKKLERQRKKINRK